MALITTTEIQKMLNNIWPNLQQIWCFDPEYICPTLTEVTDFIAENWIDTSAIKADNPDCDDFALQLHAKVKAAINWSFGEAFGNKIQGWSVLHNLNICCCQNSVILIDPLEKVIWEADRNDDNILWVRM